MIYLVVKILMKQAISKTKMCWIYQCQFKSRNKENTKLDTSSNICPNKTFLLGSCITRNGYKRELQNPTNPTSMCDMIPSKMLKIMQIFFKHTIENIHETDTKHTHTFKRKYTDLKRHKRTPISSFKNKT